MPFHRGVAVPYGQVEGDGGVAIIDCLEVLGVFASDRIDAVVPRINVAGGVIDRRVRAEVHCEGKRHRGVAAVDRFEMLRVNTCERVG